VSGTLELAPDPRSVREARTWIAGELSGIGRGDLADSAQLGVSELVTNAILHATPPIVVRLGGTPSHPRVEVQDNSTVPPSVRNMNDDSHLMATIGRGLGIVAMFSSTWGAEVNVEGKVVWFEPATDVAESGGGVAKLSGYVFDLSERVDELVAAAGEPDERLTIRLLGMPVRVFFSHRNWYEEMRRELRLLALNHGAEYPLAQELSEISLQVAQERRQAEGVEELDAAVAAGLDLVDLEYHVPTTAPATMTRLRELLEALDQFCREQKLLTLPPSPQQVALRTWYLGEFERQGRGEEPTPWPGGYAVEDIVL
jgi:anti-sigma regulatory factor (Ser/Thr protein kinase)